MQPNSLGTHRMHFSKFVHLTEIQSISQNKQKLKFFNPFPTPSCVMHPTLHRSILIDKKEYACYFPPERESIIDHGATLVTNAN